MTQEPNPGATPPTWTPEAGQPAGAPPAGAQPTPAQAPAPYAAPPAQAPYAAPPVQAPAAFAPAPINPTISTPKPKNRASAGTAILLVGALVAIGGVAFAVGRVTAPAAAAAPAFGGRGNGTGGGFGPTASGGAGGFGAAFGRGSGGVNVSGTVVSIDANSIQVKLSTGNTVTLNLDSSTTYRTATTGSASDVAPGDTVELGLAVGGRTNPSASGNPRPSGGPGGGFGGGFGAGGTVSTITVVK